MFKYTLVYVVITFAVLLFLNIYSSKISQQIFYNNKKTSMIERCLMIASEVSDLDIINEGNLSQKITQLDGLDLTRMIVTDANFIALYDSNNQVNGNYIMLPEIIQAMPGYNVFSWDYHKGAMQSRAAVPIYSYGTLIGSVYIMEYDTEQGALIQKLQNNIFVSSLILEIAVIVFSLLFSALYSRRLRKITLSMDIIRKGDYSHQVEMRGNDELKALSNAFNDLIDKLRTSEKKRNQFVSDASHELKTPLASIKLLTDSILQNDMDQTTVREFVEDIGNEADRLTRMSQKLLSLSKIDGETENDCEIVYLSPTIQKVERMLSALASEQNVTIHTDLADDCPILIHEDDLYQIIFNLVENGIKYNRPGGSLFLRLSREEENIILLVRDDGYGIPEEALDHIFERFYRVDKARSRRTGGSGLGLSIVRNLLERNHGEITVSSTVNVGTTFHVSFPVFETEVDK